MNALTTIEVGAAGGVGAVARFTLDGLVVARLHRPLPLGIFIVNVSGALLLGLLTGLSPSTTTALILGTGALGGYTTFSTWMFETERLAESGELAWAAANVAASLAAGIGAIVLGQALG